MLLGAQGGAVVSVVLIGVAISLSEGWLGWTRSASMFATDFTVTVTNTSVGLSPALIVSRAPVGDAAAARARC